MIILMNLASTQQQLMGECLPDAGSTELNQGYAFLNSGALANQTELKIVADQWPEIIGEATGDLTLDTANDAINAQKFVTTLLNAGLSASLEKLIFIVLNINQQDKFWGFINEVQKHLQSHCPKLKVYIINEPTAQKLRIEVTRNQSKLPAGENVALLSAETNITLFQTAIIPTTMAKEKECAKPPNLFSNWFKPLVQKAHPSTKPDTNAPTEKMLFSGTGEEFLSFIVSTHSMEFPIERFPVPK